MTKLIAIDSMIGSMTEFKQIIGRGTRLREKEGKTHFIVMDFRGVSRLFADPTWDGDIEVDEGYEPGRTQGGKGGKKGGDEPPKEKPFIDLNGCEVRIINKTVSVYDPSGKLLKQENIIDYTKTNILGEYASLDIFIRKWSEEEKKEKIREMFKEQGIDLESLKICQGMADVDDYDFICHVAFDKKPLTRKERANNVKKREFFSKYSGVAKEILEALLDKYMNTGIYEIEKTEVLKLTPFDKYGKPSNIAKLFGGKDGYLKAVKELEEEIYKVG
jgi:type I restriction enzyme R subunit